MKKKGQVRYDENQLAYVILPNPSCHAYRASTARQPQHDRCSQLLVVRLPYVLACGNFFGDFFGDFVPFVVNR